MILRLSLFSLSFVLVSNWFSQGADKAFADSRIDGPIETSSPEEFSKKSLSGLNSTEVSIAASKASRRTLQDRLALYGSVLNQQTELKSNKKSEPSDANLSDDESFVSPMVVSGGYFPYQGSVNITHALSAAVLALAFKSLQETGRIDFESILYLLNWTDLYAGVLGSVTSGFSQTQSARLVSWLKLQGSELSPRFISPIMNSRAMQVISHLTNGISYFFAVGGGYEYFSQFWKTATRNIDEAHTFTGFLASDTNIKIQVALSLFNCAFADANLQQRIAASVYNHRIMTFEFISMTLGLYVGMTLGKAFGNYYWAARPWLKGLAPVLGSVAFGILTLFTPESWKEAVNSSLLDYKINRQVKAMSALVSEMDQGIRAYAYPNQDVRTWGAYFRSGENLWSDIERYFRARDMTASLKFSGNPKQLLDEPAKVWAEALEVQEKSVADLRVLFETAQASAREISEAQIQTWLEDQVSMREVYRRLKLQRDAKPEDSEKLSYYSLVLESAVKRAELGAKELRKIAQIVSAQTQLSQ